MASWYSIFGDGPEPWAANHEYSPGDIALSPADKYAAYTCQVQINQGTDSNDPANNPTKWVKVLSAGASTSPPMWVSGSTYTTGTIVTSQAAGFQPYIKINSSAGGTTDPFSDSTNWTAYGASALRRISTGIITIPVNQFSSGAIINPLRNVLKTILLPVGGSIQIQGTNAWVQPILTLTDSTTVTATIPGNAPSTGIGRVAFVTIEFN